MLFVAAARRISTEALPCVLRTYSFYFNYDRRRPPSPRLAPPKGIVGSINRAPSHRALDHAPSVSHWPGHRQVVFIRFLEHCTRKR